LNHRQRRRKTFHNIDARKQIKQLIIEVSKELAESADIHEKQVTMKVLSAARGIDLLPADRIKEELRGIYTELKSEFQSSEEQWTSMRNIFFDAVLMSGIPESVKFLKEMIESNEMSKAQITNLFIWMPQYIMVPNKDVLKELFELVNIL
jgi:hypothetical protein